MACVKDVIVIFLQLILFANTAALFCSLLRLVSHSFEKATSSEGISTRWVWFEKINHLRDSWLVLINDGLQTGFHAYIAILDSFFYAYSAMGSFVVVSFFLGKHLFFAILPLTNKLSLCLFKAMLWSRWLLLWVWWNGVPAAIPVHYVFWYPAVAHILTYLVNLAFGPKSGFKNKCRAWAGFGLGLGSSFKMRPVYNSAPAPAIQNCFGSGSTTPAQECGAWSQLFAKWLEMSAIGERPVQRYSEVFGFGAEGQGFVIVVDIRSRFASFLFRWKTADTVFVMLLLLSFERVLLLSTTWPR